MHRLLSAALVLLVATAPASAGTFFETFTTNTYRDAGATTAVWDTGTGSIYLPSIGLTTIGGRSASGAKHVLQVGSTVVLDRGAAGVELIDVSNPLAPTLAGSITYSGSPAPVVFDIAVSGTILYISWWKQISVLPPITQYGVDVYSIASASAPVFVKTLAALRADAMTAHGNRLYIANGSSLLVWDITNAAFPASLGALVLGGTPRAVAVAGNTAYVAAGASGLHVVNVTSATTPSLITTQALTGTVASVAVDGFLVCASAGAAGVHLLDVTNPAAPVLAATFTGAGNAQGVRIDGDVMALADNTSRVRLVDVTVPASPVEIASTVTGGAVHDVELAGTLLFSAQDNGMGVIRNALGLAPRQVRSGAVAATPVTHIVPSGERLYLADGALRVFDNARTTPLSPLGSWGTTGINTFDVDGSLAYVMDAVGVFRVLDVSNPAAITSTGSVATGLGSAAAIVADGQLVCMLQGGSTGSSGLYTIDVSNPAAPAVAGFYNILGGVTDLDVAGATAYVFNPSVGVHILSITNPASISSLGTYSMGATFDGTVAICGNLLYIAGGRGANDLFEVVDVSTPGSPVKIGGTSLTTDDLAQVGPMVLQGTRAIIAGEQELHIVDKTDPTAPWEVHRYVPAAFHNSYAVGVAGNFAYYGLRYDPFGTPDDRVEEVRILDRGVNTSANVAQSLDFAAPAASVEALRITPSSVGSITWEYSPDGGTSFYSRVADGSWELGLGPATGMRWRATLQVQAGMPDPECTDVTIDWRSASPSITSIVDVPADEGGWVTLSFLPSAFDLVGTPPATSYEVYRRVGAVWSVVATVPATSLDSYSLNVPTVADSSLWDGIVNTSYFVRVLTAAATHFDSPADSGYSVDNIAPLAATNLTVVYNSPLGGNHLTWTHSPSTDVIFHRIHRGTTANFPVSPANAVDSTSGSPEWKDADYNGWNVFYAITAVDSAGNASPPEYPDITTDVRDRTLPLSWGLGQNVPNPFNPATTIRYDVPPGGGHVTLNIFDVNGRRVKTLVDGAQTAGEKRAHWDGRNDRGHSVASGVYFYRLTAPGYTQVRKMVLAK